MGYLEMYVIAFLASLACEALREFLCIDAYSCAQKWSEFRTNAWLIADFLVIGFFMVGVALRSHTNGDPWFFQYGMLMYKVASIYWYLRLYKYMSVHRFVGMVLCNPLSTKSCGIPSVPATRR
jgi:transient receptor potential cation channel subfamily M protein 3